MKKNHLLLFFLFTTTCLLAQSPLLQKVSIAGKNMGIEVALYHLIDKEAVELTFNNTIIPNKTIDIIFYNTPLKVVLAAILKGTNLTFEVLGQQVVIYERKVQVTEKFTISGFFEDVGTGEKLIGAGVYDKISKQGVYANAYGFYSLTLPAQKVELVFTAFGYKSQTMIFTLAADWRINQSLTSSLTFKEVIVHADVSLDLPQEVSTDILNIENVEHLPAYAGEKDIIRATHLLPGVQTGTDGVGGIYVRGGNSGQNLMLIDGVPVYYVSHAAGLFSVFNTEAISTAKLIKGGFPARYGGRLSSVMDIRTKEGNMRTFRSWANLGLLTAGGGVEGPIIKNKSSFFLSGRLSYLDLYLLPYSKKRKDKLNEEGETAYGFYDFNGKVNYSFSDTDKIYLSFYRGSDSFRDVGIQSDSLIINDDGEKTIYNYKLGSEQKLNWKNNVAALRWNHLFSDKLFANTSLTYSKLGVDYAYTQYDSLSQEQQQVLSQRWTKATFVSGIEDIGAELNFDLMPNTSQYIRFGIGIHSRNFTPGAFVSSVSTGGEVGNEVVSVSTLEYTAYVEDEFKWRNITVNAGIRAVVNSVKRQNYKFIEPRLTMKWALHPKFQLKGAFSKMTQFLHLLSSSGIGLPTDLWVPSTRKIKPQQSAQLVFGFDWKIGKMYQFSAEGYYKNMNDLLSFSEGASLENDWQKNVTQGEGYSKGIECMFSKTRGKTTGWLAYTYSKTTRTFERINFGESYPFKYDRRNDLKFVLTHRINNTVDLTAIWIYSTGFSFNLPIEKYSIQFPEHINVEQAPILFYGKKNENRMPDYHRLDVSLNWYIEREKAKHKISFSINNVYNRKNPLYRQLKRDYKVEGDEIIETNKFVEVILLPFTPSFSYFIEF